MDALPPPQIPKTMTYAKHRNWTDIVRRLSSRRTKNVTAALVFVAIVHFILLIAGFLYVKKSLLTAYRESSQSIRQLNIKYEVGINVKEGGELSRRLDSNPSPEAGELKTILLWNMPPSVSYPKMLNPDRCGRCDIVTDKSMVNRSDAVVLHYHKVTTLEALPPPETRSQEQVYVWTCRESPNTTKAIYKLDLSRMNNVINWTMTYRLDSDVFYPYAEILHRLHDDRHGGWNGTDSGTSSHGYVDLFYQSVDEVMAKKQHLAAWVVGNCDGTKGAKARMQLSKMLDEAGLEVHKFGRCFQGQDFPPYRSEEAHAKLIEYKFYLAFENTYQCRDYVTYKFWKNSIYSGAVPIVWGPAKSDLARLAPKHSFIHVEDFATLEDLVKYLNYLDSNDTAYREYFEWREHELATRLWPTDQISDGHVENSDWIFSLSESFGYCRLCKMLHDTKNIPKKSVPSLSEWWYGRERRECIMG